MRSQLDQVARIRFRSRTLGASFASRHPLALGRVTLKIQMASAKLISTSRLNSPAMFEMPEESDTNF